MLKKKFPRKQIQKNVCLKNRKPLLLTATTCPTISRCTHIHTNRQMYSQANS